MTEMNFGKNEQNIRDYYPNHGDIDWEDAWLNRHDNKKQLSVWAEAEDSLGEFKEQLHQENCAIYLNDTDPDFDCIVLVDSRDENGDFWYSRIQVGDETFNELVDEISNEVMVIYTKYPLQTISEYIMKMMMIDLEP